MNDEIRDVLKEFISAGKDLSISCEKVDSALKELNENMSESQKCVWTCEGEDNFDGYSTDCRNNFSFFEEDFDDRYLQKGDFKFCPFCGKEIEEEVCTEIEVAV